MVESVTTSNGQVLTLTVPQTVTVTAAASDAAALTMIVTETSILISRQTISKRESFSLGTQSELKPV